MDSSFERCARGWKSRGVFQFIANCWSKSCAIGRTESPSVGRHRGRPPEVHLGRSRLASHRTPVHGPGSALYPLVFHVGPCNGSSVTDANLAKRPTFTVLTDRRSILAASRHCEVTWTTKRSWRTSDRVVLINRDRLRAIHLPEMYDRPIRLCEILRLREIVNVGNCGSISTSYFWWFLVHYLTMLLR